MFKNRYISTNYKSANRELFNRIKIVFLFLLLLKLGCSSSLFSQTPISGEINTVLSAVTSVGSDFVTVNDITGFQAGDTVLVIQMKGSLIFTDEDITYGFSQNFEGTPGGYEFIIIQSIIPADRIVFGSNLINNYSVEGMVQVIKVRSFPAATVTGGSLTCREWNPVTGTGGVLAFIVGGNLYLQDNIDVSGKGFRGGDISEGTGICVNDNLALRNRYSYAATDNYSGFKGEGLSIRNNSLQSLFPAFAKGKGANFTGGGGGNGRFSGGGGGSSFGGGGNGNREFLTCTNPADPPFGKGGYAPSLVVPVYQNGVFMGSGGGASTYTAGGTASPGGNGGGIVIIVADTIFGNGHSIYSHGRRPAVVATGDAGAGGGGAGGSIAISANSYGTSALTLSVNGGGGGRTTNNNGSGGGGGGGRVWGSKSLTANVTTSSAGGAGGWVNWIIGDSTQGNSPGGTIAGSPGIFGGGFAVKLNGFLFNSIRSSFPGYTDVDSICAGQVPMKLMGTEPVGGATPYTFLWQKSYDAAFTTPANLVNSESPGVNFTPYDAETDTLWFRRIVTDASGTPIVDISKAVKIIVQPVITENIVGRDTTICFGQDPLELTHYNTGPVGGNGIYSYQWNESLDNVTFIPAIVNPNTGFSYDPPPLDITKFYQRVITSGRCLDVSNSVKVTVLPVVTGNTIAADQVICESDLFADLTGSGPAGGDGTYSYGWLSRTSSTQWAVATGTANLQNYNPDESEFPAVRLFSRVVYSGAFDVCRDTSTAVTLTMHPAIVNNVLDIAGALFQEVCYDSLPGNITGGLPLGGDGVNYVYLWEQSPNGIDSWITASGTNDQQNFQPPPLQNTLYYRRVVSSSACTNISNLITITVHQPITDFGISLISLGADTTLCFGGTPNLLKGGLSGGGTGIPGDYQYSWFYSEDNTTWIPVPSAGALPDYQPGALTVTTYFRRDVVSGACMRTSNVITVNILPLIGNNTMPADLMTCFNTAPILLNATTPTGGSGSYSYLWEQSADAGNTWIDASGTGNAVEDYQPPAISVPMQYRRVVYSGLSDCCIDVSAPVSIGINPLPTGSITSLADNVCQGGTVTMEIVLGGSTATPYNIVYSSGTGNVTIPSVGTTTHSVTLSPPTTTAPSTTTTYTLASVTDANGCQATSLTGSYEVVAYRNPVARTNPDNSDEVCGLIYDLNPVPSVGAGEWLKSGVPVTDITDLGGGRERVTINQYGTWSFWWKETNWECRDSVKVDIKFWDNPSPVSAGPGSTITIDFAKLDAAVPVNFTSMSWSGPPDVEFDDAADPGSWVRGLRLGSNLFTWTVENGKCLLDDELTITFNPIPGGFSPDGDNINEVFEIPGLEGTENELIILNIAGTEVRRFTNYSSLTGYWDGFDSNGKELPDGTYFYFLTITKPYQSRIPGGYVIIKRRLDE